MCATLFLSFPTENGTHSPPNHCIKRINCVWSKNCIKVCIKSFELPGWNFQRQFIAHTQASQKAGKRSKRRALGGGCSKIDDRSMDFQFLKKCLESGDLQVEIWGRRSGREAFGKKAEKMRKLKLIFSDFSEIRTVRTLNRALFKRHKTHFNKFKANLLG